MSDKAQKHHLNDLYVAREAKLNRFRAYRDAIDALRTPADQIEKAVELIQNFVEIDSENEHHRQRALEILIGMPCTDVDRSAAILYLEQLRASSEVMYAHYAKKYEALLVEGF